MNNYEQAFKTVIDIEGVDAIRTKLVEERPKYYYDDNGNEYWYGQDGKRHYTKDEG